MTPVASASVIDNAKELIGGLIGLELTTCESNLEEIFTLAEYVNDKGDILGYIASDLAGGCRMGSALTHIPPGRADEAIAEGQLPEGLAENFYEILNVSSNLLRPSDGSRVLVGRVTHDSTSELFAEFKAGFDALEKTDIGFEVQRYGVCQISVAKVAE